MLSAFLFQAYASVFVYYPVSIESKPVPPSLTFDDPPYNYTCTALVRTSRGAITYNDFESNRTDWATLGGGSVKFVGTRTGAKGNILQFDCTTGGGIGDHCQYYWTTSVSSYSSLWVHVHVWPYIYYGETALAGIALMSGNTTNNNNAYFIGIYYSGGNYSLAILKSGAKNPLGTQSISGYTPGSAFMPLFVYYNVTSGRSTTVSISAYLYDINGNLRASVNYTDNKGFRVAYVGVDMYKGYDYFDDFIISTVDPRTVTFNGLQSGLTFNIYDNLGSLTYSFTATSSTYTLNVIKDVVLGTGSGGNIQVLKPDGSICLNVTIPTNDAFLGGDSYSLITKPLSWSISSSNTSASVSAYISSNSNNLTSFSNNLTSFYAIGLKANQNYYIQLQLNAQASAIAPGLNAQIGIQGGSQSIAISNWTVSQSSTDWVQVSSGSTTYITVSNAYSSSSSSSKLTFNILACTAGRLGIDPASGACVEYPLTITLNSG